MSQPQDEFDTKSSTRTIVEMADYVGELILFTPTEYIPLEKDASGNVIGGGINTENGRKDAVITDMVVLTKGNQVFKDVMLLQGHLVGDLKRRVETGRKRLAVLAKGEPKKKGWNAPYVLEDATEDHAQMARDYLAGRTVAAATAPVADDPFAV